MKTLSALGVLGVFKSKGYSINRDVYAMNIFAIRTADNTANSFNDVLGVLFMDERGGWQLRTWDCTTDAGLYYRLNPMNVEGTAIIVPGQYTNVYKVGLHKGQEAMEQIGNLKYIRDNNKNAVLDWVYNLVGAKFEVANNRTDIHRAGANSIQVDKWSAGCIVAAKETNYITFLTLIKSSINEYHHPNIFDFTLFEEKDF